ncbi:hypothetical protein OROHE_013306 [Orobanche hederae]
MELASFLMKGRLEAFGKIPLRVVTGHLYGKPRSKLSPKLHLIPLSLLLIFVEFPFLVNVKALEEVRVENGDRKTSRKDITLQEKWKSRWIPLQTEFLTRKRPFYRLSLDGLERLGRKVQSKC